MVRRGSLSRDLLGSLQARDPGKVLPPRVSKDPVPLRTLTRPRDRGPRAFRLDEEGQVGQGEGERQPGDVGAGGTVSSQGSRLRWEGRHASIAGGRDIPACLDHHLRTGRPDLSLASPLRPGPHHARLTHDRGPPPRTRG